MRFLAYLSRNPLILTVPLLVASCNNAEHPEESTEAKTQLMPVEEPEWFDLRPEAEKAYGYTHAVRIGTAITISGAVSMDDTGAPTAVGDLAQQLKNCYSDLDKVLKHYCCTFDDVVAENVFTTHMAEFIKQSGYRNTIYTERFPAGSWIEVKGLALPEFLIEIELEVHKAR
jgi:2-iminobutanoate/2-iminopropanoate deaminase